MEVHRRPGNLNGRSVELVLMNLAAEVARRAGDLVANGRAAGRFEFATKSSPTDVVTEWDAASERFIESFIARHRPDDGMIGEEGTASAGTSGVSWLVDPIDGTTNFLYGLPGWAVSVAAIETTTGLTLAGAVHVPSQRETFVAARGHGSWLGGRRLDVRSRTERPAPTLSTALVATGFGYDPERRRRQGRRAAWLLPRVRDIRRFGAAAVELCHVAAGRVDAYVEDGLGAWDIAAGSLVATEAGAVATDFAGGPVRPAEVLVAHPDIHTGIIELLHSCPGDEEWPG